MIYRSASRNMLFCASSALSLIIAMPALAQATPASEAPVATAQKQASVVPDAPGAPQPPAGSASAPPSSPGDNTVQAVVVLGVRGAQQAAIREKEISAQIQDSIVAEDIGKLPDATIADSLQRVPGVEIERDAGEGAAINIRGIPNVLTTINGEIFLDGGGSSVGVGSDAQASAGGGLTTAQPNLEDVPAGLMAGVDVIKSPQSSDISGGISGILALKTRRPLDLQQGVTASLGLQGDNATVSGNWNQNYNGLLGYNNGKFGALFAFAYTNETLADYHDNTGYQMNVVTSPFIGFNPQGGSTLGNSTAIGSHDYVYQPVYYANNNNTVERQRLGLNSSFQYKFTDALTATVDLAYLHLDNRALVEEVETQTNNAVNNLQPGAVVSQDGGLINGNLLLNHFQSHSENDFTNSDAGDTSFKLDYNAGGRFRASLRYVGDMAVQNISNAFADNLATTLISGAVPRNAAEAAAGMVESVNPGGVPTTNVVVPVSGIPGLTQTAQSGVLVNVRPTGNQVQQNYITNVSDPGLYSQQSTWANGSHTYAQVNVVRGDAAYDADLGILKTIEFGGRFSDRAVKVDDYQLEAYYGGTGINNQYYFKDPLIVDPSFGYSIIPERPFSSLPPGYVTLAHIPGVNQPIPTINPKAMNSAVAFENTLAPGLIGNQEVINPALSYKVTEKETSGYIQGDFAGDLPFVGLHYSGNVGVRLVDTQLTIYQNNLSQTFTGAGGSYNGVFLADGQIVSHNDYFDALPDFNVAFDVTDKQKLRLAVNKAVARQDLSLLGQAFQAYYVENNGRYANQPASLQIFSSASSGNPNLQPFRSTNWQGSYEWYFHRGSLLSAALFYIDVASFPLSSTVDLAGPQEADGDGVVRAGGPVSTTVNGGGGSIKGVELSYQQAFDFLPSLLSGFGTDLNFTLADGTTNNVDSTGQKEMLPDNSKYQANAILFYQKGPWQARVAYNWRSKEFLANEPGFAPSGSGQSSQNVLGVYAKPIGFLDSSISYDVNRHLTIFAQATNMTGSSQHQYLEYPDVFYGSYAYETRVFFGIRLRN